MRNLILAVVFFSLLGIFLLLVGCQEKPTIEIPTTPYQNLIQTAKNIDWLVLASIIGIGIGAYLLFKGNDGGLAVIAASAIVLVTSLAVVGYPRLLAICGASGLILFLVYKVAVKTKAIPQLIDTVKETRKCLTKEDDERLFTDKNSVIKTMIQDESTTKLVKKELTKNESK